MLCPSCATQNDEGGAFCVGCGAALAPAAWNPPAAPTSASTWNPPASPPSSSTPGGFYSPTSPMAGASSQNVGPITDLPVVDALILPLQDPDAAPRLGVGALLALVPIIGHVWLVGYVLQWTRTLMRGETRRLPEWTDFGNMFFEGMWASAIMCIFSFVPMALTAFLAIPKIMSLFSRAANGGHIDPFEVVVSIFGYLALGLFLVVIFSLPVPLALCHYARTGDLLGSMSPSAWWPLIMQSPLEFAGCWATVLCAAFVGWVVLGFLNIVPILGTLICFVAGLALSVVIMLSTQTMFTRYWLRHAGRALGG